MTVAEFRERIAKKTPKTKKAKREYPCTPSVSYEPSIDSLVVTLPMPVAELSVNGGIHWRARYRAIKAAHRLVASVVSQDWFKGRSVASYKLQFIFPDHCRRDFDNFTGRCKAYLDQLAELAGQDDHEWDMEKPSRSVVKNHNEVRITLKFKEEGAQ